jgi:hypothetical protein
MVRVVATSSSVPQASSPEENPSAPPNQPSPRKSNQTVDQVAQTIVLAVLFACPALLSVHGAAVADPDIWWHLRTGEWIVQHHALPRVDYFSAPNAGKPWQPYSWLFELLAFKCFQRFGLAGIVGYTASMLLAVGVASRHLVKRLQPDFILTTLLSATACYALLRLYTPRPWLFTILFFVLELDILMHARKTGKTIELLWLPVIFALWANLHIQFIDGLAVLGLALVEALLARRTLSVSTRLRARWAFAALAASVLATLVNPFGWHIYRVAYDLAAQPGIIDKIGELQALGFRQFTDFLLLALAMAAAFALGWDRHFRFFESGLFVFAAFVSFRSQRDLWVMAFAATAILASTIVSRPETPVRLPRIAVPAAALLAALAVFAGFRMWRVNQALLQNEIATNLPARAVQQILVKGYPGPLYNNFDWGGYLIWALRMPVSIDGRAAFYGNDAIDRSKNSWNGMPDWASDPQLQSAGIVLGPVKAPLTQLLRTDPHFKLVYENDLSAVFVARR